MSLAEYLGISHEVVLNGMWISIFSLLGYEAIREIYIHLIGTTKEE